MLISSYFSSYSKEENIKLDDPKLLAFTHLLVEQKGRYFFENEDIRRTHDILDTINCFNNIGVEYRSVFPIKIKTRPCIIILRRKLDIAAPQIEIAYQHTVDDIHVDNNVNIENSQPIAETEYQENLELIEDLVLNGKEENENEYEKNDEENAEELDDPLNLLDNTIPNDDDQNNIVETELKKPTIETKRKLERLIERHYQSKVTKEPLNERNDLLTANKQSIKSKVRNIIREEKIKEMIEKISQIDLRTVCDLERETTKQCIIKIIDSYVD